MKMPRFDIVFWQNIVSPHQAPTLRALHALGHRITVVANDLISPRRLAQGWQPPRLDGIRVVIVSPNDDVSAFVAALGNNAIHVLAGAQVGPMGNRVLRECVKQKKKLGIISESPDTRGLRYLPTLAKYRWNGHRFGEHIDFVLAMGKRGVTWFRQCGYSESKIYPYIYTVDIDYSPPPELTNDVIFRMCFVGQLVKRKGVDILLRALKQGHFARSYQLSVIGTGPMESLLRRTAKTLGIHTNIVWKGQMPSAAVGKEISNSDVLVLPSREDGWGAVVNEALMLGVPVVCSSACGARDLIRAEWLGSVFSSENVDALATELRNWCTRTNRNLERRFEIQSWAKRISGESAALYLTSILYHVYLGQPRPSAPWHKTEAAWLKPGKEGEDLFV